MLPTRLGSLQVFGMPPMNCHRGRSGPRGCPPGEYFLRQVDFLPAHARHRAVSRQREGVADDRCPGVDLYLGDDYAQEVSGLLGAVRRQDQELRVFPDLLQVLPGQSVFSQGFYRSRDTSSSWALSLSPGTSRRFGTKPDFRAR